MNSVKPAPSAYELSRAYAQGWGFARKLAASNKMPMQAAAYSNPCTSEEERSRWMTGFSDGLASPVRRSASAIQNSWRPNSVSHLARRHRIPK